jgi:hypothetical protein
MPTTFGIFTQMRPPVAAVECNSPLKTKMAQSQFRHARQMRDTSGFKVTKEVVLDNFTNDGRLVDTKWNGRHHVGPSLWNDTNHNFHRVSNR